MRNAIAKGVDVSDWQGVIDWDTVKNDVDFAILKMGIGNDMAAQDDSQFERNAAECERLGIPWGAYLYSYATDLNEAESEYQHIIRLLKGKKPSYPVYIDMEDADGYKAKNKVGDDTCVAICEYICAKLEQAGMYAAIYSNLDWFANKLHDRRLDRFDKWVAQYYQECQYAGKYGMWQHASDGHVAGINACVDMNICYEEYPAKIKSAGLNGWTAQAKPETAMPDIQQEQQVYTVHSGDTLCGIASLYKMDLQDLLSLNPQINDPNLIFPGQIIHTACSCAQTQIPNVTYTVQDGDTLWGIAASQLGDGARYIEIKQCNGLGSDTIFPGQILLIP